MWEKVRRKWASLEAEWEKISRGERRLSCISVLGATPVRAPVLAMFAVGTCGEAGAARLAPAEGCPPGRLSPKKLAAVGAASAEGRHGAWWGRWGRAGSHGPTLIGDHLPHPGVAAHTSSRARPPDLLPTAPLSWGCQLWLCPSFSSHISRRGLNAEFLFCLLRSGPSLTQSPDSVASPFLAAAQLPLMYLLCPHHRASLPCRGYLLLTAGFLCLHSFAFFSNPLCLDGQACALPSHRTSRPRGVGEKVFKSISSAPTPLNS